ncbi:MAG: alpha/beta hydrolase [Halanaeroarchaeum sp.]
MRETTVTIPAGEDRIAGTLFRPDRRAPPVVIMAHGFAARRHWGLPAIARTFADRGLAALTLDYRGFGDSTGSPRRLVSAARQRADYRRAIAFVRDREDLDGDALALWGTSYSGGHVLALAATERIEAAVATVPFTDGLHVTAHALRHGGVDSLGKMGGALLREVPSLLGLGAPHEVPVVDDPGEEFAVLSAPHARAGLRSIVPDDEWAAWPNRTPARVLLEIPTNRPIARAPAVDVPVFVLAATDDDVVPSGAVDRLVDRLDDVHRVRVPGGHFDVLTDPLVDRVADRQARFLETHLA